MVISRRHSSSIVSKTATNSCISKQAFRGTCMNIKWSNFSLSKKYLSFNTAKKKNARRYANICRWWVKVASKNTRKKKKKQETNSYFMKKITLRWKLCVHEWKKSKSKIWKNISSHFLNYTKIMMIESHSREKNNFSFFFSLFFSWKIAKYVQRRERRNYKYVQNENFPP